MSTCAGEETAGGTQIGWMDSDMTEAKHVHAVLRSATTSAIKKIGFSVIRSMEFFGTNEKRKDEVKAA